MSMMILSVYGMVWVQVHLLATQAFVCTGFLSPTPLAYILAGGVKV